MIRREAAGDLQSPHDMGSYLGGFLSSVQVGITPSTQLKFSPGLGLVLFPWIIDRRRGIKGGRGKEEVVEHTEEERH